ncbi:flavin reductase [Gangjinia marincola]|uniref:Flavin reductase n=1 Tax=Gangjinia marincola TaxID=578463 RepID=A0ABN1MJU5_9FLAO
MTHFTAQQLDALDKRYRSNLINCISGYKSANLIGTQDTKGHENLAIFSSVVHLGANPPLLGFIMRPTKVVRHTYENIKTTGAYTINHIAQSWSKKAHQTAARYDKEVSEFDKTKLTSCYLENFNAPYVQESPVKIGCTFKNEYHIKENNTRLIVGEIAHLYLESTLLHEDGFVQLDRAYITAINGLDGYALPQLKERFSYAKPDHEITSLYHERS